MRFILLLLGSAFLLTACGSTPATDDAKAETRVAAKADTPMAATPPLPPKVSELDDPASPLARRSVYFPYDVYAIDRKYDEALNAHAGYIGRHRQAHVTVEGNADERGSREYNLALGQKRAEAVKRVLVMRGASEAQMEAISYGKERPKESCHEERCWQENRRADLIYNTPKK